MDLLRRHIAPLVAALMLVAMAAVPLAHRWLHHDAPAPTAETAVQVADTHCDLCATHTALPPAPAPSGAVALVADAPAPPVVFDTGVARLLEAIGRAPPIA